MQGTAGRDQAALPSAAPVRRRGASQETLRSLAFAMRRLAVACATLLLAFAVAFGLLLLITLGQDHFGSIAIGQSIALTAFSLCLIVAAVECRSETETVLTTATFDSKQMNWAMLGEAILAVLVTQMDVFNRLLGTTQINLREFGWALVPAIALLALWELGKLIARRSASRAATPSAISER